MAVMLGIVTLFHLKQTYFSKIQWLLSHTQKYILKLTKKLAFRKNPIIRKLVENLYSKMYTTVLKPVNKLC